MAKKLRKEEWAVGKSLEAALELMGWQAELLRSALRQVKQQADRPPSRKKFKDTPPPAKTPTGVKSNKT